LFGDAVNKYIAGETKNDKTLGILCPGDGRGTSKKQRKKWG
jgi:hypothetical protein